ncbi:MAG: VanZ family protein [Ramlibacter sp.]|nr:VanZ family protein [Ramlibacter sp.]
MKAPLTMRKPAAVLLSSTSTWWALAIAYYVSGCLLHLRFSLWLVRPRDSLLGRIAYADFVPHLVAAAAAGLFLWVVVAARRSPRPRLTMAAWLFWLAAVALIDRYLTFSFNEYAHYPQYALLAWLLARAMDPQRTRWYVGRVLFWTTLAGMGDELLQYLWITTRYSDYLDFNDFLTNLVAAAAGVLLYYSTAERPREPVQRRQPAVETMVAFALIVAVAAGLLTGRMAQTPEGKVPPGGILRGPDGISRLYLQRGPAFYGSRQGGQRHERYHVLAPAPGLVVMLMVGLLFAGYGRNPQGRGRANGLFRTSSCRPMSRRFILDARSPPSHGAK